MSTEYSQIEAILEHLKGFIEKDYLSEKQAAEYTCVSPRQFRKLAKEYGIFAAVHMGKKVYRKADIQNSIENKFKSLVLPH